MKCHLLAFAATVMYLVLASPHCGARKLAFAEVSQPSEDTCGDQFFDDSGTAPGWSTQP